MQRHASREVFEGEEISDTFYIPSPFRSIASKNVKDITSMIKSICPKTVEIGHRSVGRRNYPNICFVPGDYNEIATEANDLLSMARTE